jgi:hypothetical protein
MTLSLYINKILVLPQIIIIIIIIIIIHSTFQAAVCCGENNPKKISPSTTARPKLIYRLGFKCYSNFN